MLFVYSMSPQAVYPSNQVSVEMLNHPGWFVLLIVFFFYIDVIMFLSETITFINKQQIIKLALSCLIDFVLQPCFKSNPMFPFTVVSKIPFLLMGSKAEKAGSLCSPF